MIVVDSSALIAIYFDEIEKGSFAEAIVMSDRAVFGAPNLLEASMVVEGRQAEWGCRDLDKMIVSLGLDIISFGPTHIESAREAFRRFGKGRHRASLNFGDCCAYGLAKTLNAPLLFKGNDFALTDIERAL